VRDPVMDAVVTAGAGIGVAADGGRRDHAGHDQSTATQRALDSGTRHRLSPTPFFDA